MRVTSGSHTLILGTAAPPALGWAWADTLFGAALAITSPQGLCGLGLAQCKGQTWAMGDMTARWPSAQFTPDASAAELAQRALLGGNCTLHLIGSAFDLRVWQELLRIPHGQTTSYAQIAAAIGAPRAARAVASAIGRNPISLLIPCHRVLRSTGALGGYHWGLALKQDILAHERANIPQVAQEFAISSQLAIP
jgi:AraC family transcriptional regulator, regulatory protein of adaptative response / methylated-DNA-[protein]-cysteine methyltransferase